MTESTTFHAEVRKMESSVEHTFCTFLLHGGLFGIDALAVKEVTVLPTPTPIPHAPEAARGYVNLRGQIVLVLDLNRLLHLGPSTIGPDTRLVVFRGRLGDPFGILVDRIGDIVTLGGEQIKKRGNGAFSREGTGDEPQEALLAGIGKLDDRLLTILDAGKLLPQIETEIAEHHEKTYH